MFANVIVDNLTKIPNYILLSEWWGEAQKKAQQKNYFSLTAIFINCAIYITTHTHVHFKNKEPVSKIKSLEKNVNCAYLVF